jgi:chemotaxis protein MotB
MPRHGGRRRGAGHEEEGGDERWLLSYADMMTLLVALFMVLFSISSVNTSKYEGLQRSLKDAFSGRVLPGGTSIASAGGAATDNRVIAPPRSTSPLPQPGGRADTGTQAQQAAQARAEADRFRRLKRQVDAFTRKAGIAGQVTTRVSRDGLHIRVLTDKLLFDSGSAAPKVASLRLLAKLGSVLATEHDHRILVEGHTDSMPIASAQFPSNWELSGARAAAVVRSMVQAGVSPDRLTASGRADRSEVTGNDSPAGRQLNRRVEILLPRTATGAVVAPDAAATTPAPVAAGDPDLTHPLGERIVPLPAMEAHP